jgi:hypothetical protein
MENFGNLKLKNCACCGKRLDTVPKRDVRRVNESDLLNNINTVTILYVLLYYMLYEL